MDILVPIFYYYPFTIYLHFAFTIYSIQNFYHLPSVINWIPIIFINIDYFNLTLFQHYIDFLHFE